MTSFSWVCLTMSGAGIVLGAIGMYRISRATARLQKMEDEHE